jgi:hypothetical protein
VVFFKVLPGAFGCAPFLVVPDRASFLDVAARADRFAACLVVFFWMVFLAAGTAAPAVDLDFLAAGFFATGFLATGFFATGFFATGFFATGFLAAGFLAADFLAVGFFAFGFFAVAGLEPARQPADRGRFDFVPPLAFFLLAATPSLLSPEQRRAARPDRPARGRRLEMAGDSRPPEAARDEDRVELCEAGTCQNGARWY